MTLHFGMRPLVRFIDIAGATIGLVVLSPFFLLVAAWVHMQDGGPVFYRARRVGRGGRGFHLLKFRTMVPQADRLGGGLTVNGDDRVTRAGRVLRRFKIDELPQLWNVVRGDMSLVGPRPEDPRYVALYDSEQRGILMHLPGITSPASLAYRHEEALLTGPDWQQAYLNHVLPEKLALDLAYFHRRTLTSDMLLIGRTIVRIVR